MNSKNFVILIAKLGADVNPLERSNTSAIITVSGSIIAMGLKYILTLSGSTARPM